MLNIKIKKINKFAVIPQKTFNDDAGLDLYSVEEYTIKPSERLLVKTGLIIQLPENTEAQIRPRSGLAYKHGITVLNTPGTIDAGYRGEIKILLINHGSKEFFINVGERIAQLVIKPIYEVNFEEVKVIDETHRGISGFGSSGML